MSLDWFQVVCNCWAKAKNATRWAQKGTTMEFFNLKQPRGANKYPQYTAVYSKYTAVYSRVYGRILRYWSLEYTAVYPKSPKWGIFKHNIDHHNWPTRGIPQPTYACMHCALLIYIRTHLYMPHTPFSQNPLFYPYTPRYSWYARLCSPYTVIASGASCPAFHCFAWMH